VKKEKAALATFSFWWRWRKPKLRFGHLLRKSSRFCVPFASQKTDDAVSIPALHSKIQQKAPLTDAFCVMVEMAVIETASENTFPQISTSVAVHFRFPLRNAARQAFRFGSPVLCDGLQGSVPVHIYR